MARCSWICWVHRPSSCLVAFHTGAEFEAEERGLVDALIRSTGRRRMMLDLLILCGSVRQPRRESRSSVPARLAGIFGRYDRSTPSTER